MMICPGHAHFRYADKGYFIRGLDIVFVIFVEGRRSLLMSLMARRTDGLALPHPYHEERSCRKFDQIPPNGFGGDRKGDRWTDAIRTNGQKKLF